MWPLQLARRRRKLLALSLALWGLWGPMGPHSPHSPTHGPTGAGSPSGTPWSLEFGHGEGQIASYAIIRSHLDVYELEKKQRFKEFPGPPAADRVRGHRSGRGLVLVFRESC